MARPLAKRLAADPEFSVMLLANPVLALERYGIKLSDRLRTHVLRALRHPKALRDRRAELESRLEAAIGEKPRPCDPEWLAHYLFEVRKLSPKDIAGLSPAYRFEDPGGIVAALEKARRPATSRYPGIRRIPVTSRLGVAKPAPSIRRLDLNADLPELSPAETAPDTLPLEQAWFYKDDPIARDLVELGTIERRAFRFRTPADFRAIARGQKVDGFRAFVTAVRVDPAKRP